MIKINIYIYIYIGHEKRRLKSHTLSKISNTTKGKSAVNCNKNFSHIDFLAARYKSVSWCHQTEF
jgi:hypothetical protein